MKCSAIQASQIVYFKPNGTFVGGVGRLQKRYAPVKPLSKNLRGGRSIVGTHGLVDRLHDSLLVALSEGVSEDLNREVTDDTLEDGLIGGHASLLEGRNLLSNPGDQDELGAGYFARKGIPNQIER